MTPSVRRETLSGGDMEAAAGSVTCQTAPGKWWAWTGGLIVGTGYVLSSGRVPHALRNAALSPSSLLLKPSIPTFGFSIFPFPHGIEQGVWSPGWRVGAGGSFRSVRQKSIVLSTSRADWHHTVLACLQQAGMSITLSAGREEWVPGRQLVSSPEFDQIKLFGL